MDPLDNVLLTSVACGLAMVVPTQARARREEDAVSKARSNKSEPEITAPEVIIVIHESGALI